MPSVVGVLPVGGTVILRGTMIPHLAHLRVQVRLALLKRGYVLLGVFGSREVRTPPNHHHQAPSLTPTFSSHCLSQPLLTCTWMRAVARLGRMG